MTVPKSTAMIPSCKLLVTRIVFVVSVLDILYWDTGPRRGSFRHCSYHQRSEFTSTSGGKNGSFWGVGVFPKLCFIQDCPMQSVNVQKSRHLNSFLQFSLRVRSLFQTILHKNTYGFRSAKHRLYLELSHLHFHIPNSAIAKSFSFTRGKAQALLPLPQFHSIPTYYLLNNKSRETARHRVSNKLKTDT